MLLYYVANFQTYAYHKINKTNGRKSSSLFLCERKGKKKNRLKNLFIFLWFSGTLSRIANDKSLANFRPKKKKKGKQRFSNYKVFFPLFSGKQNLSKQGDDRNSNKKNQWKPEFAEYKIRLTFDQKKTPKKKNKKEKKRLWRDSLLQ